MKKRIQQSINFDDNLTMDRIVDISLCKGTIIKPLDKNFRMARSWLELRWTAEQWGSPASKLEKKLLQHSPIKGPTIDQFP